MLVTRRAAIVLHRVQRLQLFHAVRLARPGHVEAVDLGGDAVGLDHRAAKLDQHGECLARDVMAGHWPP